MIETKKRKAEKIGSNLEKKKVKMQKRKKSKETETQKR